MTSSGRQIRRPDKFDDKREEQNRFQVPKKSATTLNELEPALSTQQDSDIQNELFSKQ